MQKVWTMLLLISAVIGMTMPGMATPSSDVSSEINVDVDGSNHAVNEIEQSLDNDGDLKNEALVVVLGGDAEAESNADADASADNDGDAEAGDDESEDNVALAGNLLSGNAVALSGSADARGGNAENGDVVQVNAVVQFATADITNLQVMKQKVIVPVDINTDVTETVTEEELSVEIDDIVVGNEIDGDENDIDV